MFELDPSRGRPSGPLAPRRVGALLLGVEELEHPLGRGEPGLEDVDHRGQHLERQGELPGVLDEGLDVADADGPAGHPQAADHGDGHVVEVADQEHQPAACSPDMNWAPKLACTARRWSAEEPFLDLALAAERLHDGVAGERLLDQGVEAAGVPPLGDEAGPGPDRDEPDDASRERERWSARPGPAAARS